MLRCGIDSIDIQRIEDGIARLGERFLNRFFTAAERADCLDKPHRLAARIAAKEAVGKALGTGIGDVSRRDRDHQRSARPADPHPARRGRQARRRHGPDRVGRQPDSHGHHGIRCRGRTWSLSTPANPGSLLRTRYGDDSLQRACAFWTPLSATSSRVRLEIAGDEV